MILLSPYVHIVSFTYSRGVVLSLSLSRDVSMGVVVAGWWLGWVSKAAELDER